QRAQAVQGGALAQSPAGLIAVDEALSRASPREAGICVADIGEAGMVRGVPAGRNCLDGGSFAFGRRPLHPLNAPQTARFPNKEAAIRFLCEGTGRRGGGCIHDAPQWAWARRASAPAAATLQKRQKRQRPVPSPVRRRNRNRQFYPEVSC